jgi:hypothetical protein
MKTKLILPITLALTFISCSPAQASCYGLSGYAMLNCLEQDKRQSAQDSFYREQQKNNAFQSYEQPLPKLRRFDSVNVDMDGNVYNQQNHRLDD